MEPLVKTRIVKIARKIFEDGITTPMFFISAAFSLVLFALNFFRNLPNESQNEGLISLGEGIVNTFAFGTESLIVAIIVSSLASVVVNLAIFSVLLKAFKRYGPFDNYDINRKYLPAFKNYIRHSYLLIMGGGLIIPTYLILDFTIAALLTLPAKINPLRGDRVEKVFVKLIGSEDNQ